MIYLQYYCPENNVVPSILGVSGCIILMCDVTGRAERAPIKGN